MPFRIRARLPSHEPAREHRRPGLLAVGGHLEIWHLVVLVVITNELGATARDLGFVYAASGLGAVLAAFVMAQREPPRRAITLMYAGFTLEVATLVVYGSATAVWPMLIAASVAGIIGAAITVAFLFRPGMRDLERRPLEPKEA